MAVHKFPAILSLGVLLLRLLLVLTGLLSNGGFVECHQRYGVAIIGTTIDPQFRRSEGKEVGQAAWRF